MTCFLDDNQNVYSYESLLKDVSDANSYVPALRTSNLYDYFLNIIVALVNNKHLILIDADLSNLELDGLEEDNSNKELFINSVIILSFGEIVDRIMSSSSEISIFTSGTTGQPKKVIHSVQTLIRNVRISEQYLNQIWAFAYNPTHMAGLQVFFQALLNTNIIINVFNHTRSQVYRDIEKYSITHISATPTFYRLLLPLEKKFNSVQRVTFGGEKSDNKLHDDILQIFPNAKINNIYASTEAGSLFSTKGENFQIPSSIIDKIKVVDGELLVHESLLGKSESFNFSNDFYNTGDLVEWVNSEKGLFRFISRKNELINVGGYKVNPLEVESIILQINGVLQVVVFGKQNSVLGNILCAEVILQESSNLSEFEIRNFLSGKLQDFKIPRKIKFVDKITITRTGKIKRK